jgi:hypothetical protein
MGKQITFDHVFKYWLINELDVLEERDLLALAKSKGFNSIVEWRLATALRLGMDTKAWEEIVIDNPNETLPKIIVGPFQGWSKFFDNQFETSFARALEIPAFFDWCQTHNRIPDIAEKFPAKTEIVLFQKPNGDYIHIEGGHRICAVAYAQKLGKRVESQVTAAVAQITEEEIGNLKQFLKDGTEKQPKN